MNYIPKTVLYKEYNYEENIVNCLPLTIEAKENIQSFLKKRIHYKIVNKDKFWIKTAIEINNLVKWENNVCDILIYSQMLNIVIDISNKDHLVKILRLLYEIMYLNIDNDRQYFYNTNTDYTIETKIHKNKLFNCISTIENYSIFDSYISKLYIIEYFERVIKFIDFIELNVSYINSYYKENKEALMNKKAKLYLYTRMLKKFCKQSIFQLAINKLSL